MEFDNKRKYLRAPTKEEIITVLNHLDISARHFEHFFNIYPNCIAQCLMKNNTVTVPDGRQYKRKLPAKYWHLIFENLPEKKEVLKKIGKPQVSKPKIKRAKKVVMDEKILALL